MAVSQSDSPDARAANSLSTLLSRSPSPDGHGCGRSGGRGVRGGRRVGSTRFGYTIQGLQVSRMQFQLPAVSRLSFRKNPQFIWKQDISAVSSALPNQPVIRSCDLTDATSWEGLVIHCNPLSQPCTFQSNAMLSFNPRSCVYCSLLNMSA